MRGINHHQFDIHMAHGCNFTCESCSHFSQYKLSGMLSVATAQAWYDGWKGRLRPFKINLLGGEPMLNPSLAEHISLAREAWPMAKLFIYTNGMLLHRHPWLPIAMRQAGQVYIRLSRHYRSPEYDTKFNVVVGLLASWRRRWGIQYEVMDSIGNWTERYGDVDGAIQQFASGDSRASWEACRAKYCIQLHDGMLWKCPLLAYLPMVKSKRQLGPEWDECLSYKGLSPSCTEAELVEFLGREHEAFCSACPSTPRRLEKVLPSGLVRLAAQKSGT